MNPFPEGENGTIDDLISDASAPSEEQPDDSNKPSLKDRYDDGKAKKAKYDKWKADRAAKNATKAGNDAGKTGKTASEAGKAGAAAAKTGATAAKAGAATGAEAGAVAGEAGVAAVAGAPTAGVGALVVVAIDLSVRTGKWAAKHRKTLLWILLFLAFSSIVSFLLLGAFCAHIQSGGLGKAVPNPSGTKSTDLKNINELSEKPTDVRGFNQIIFKDKKDKDYINTGEADGRLLKILDYLASKHKSIRISHIISDYQDMDTNEAGTDTDPQIISNVSAHKDGLAADIDEVDFVYKVFRENNDCSVETFGLVGDIYYYNDLNKELLKLKCMGFLWDTSKTNTTWQGEPAQAIPIKILYQDCKPNIKHAGNEPDPCVNIQDIIKDGGNTSFFSGGGALDPATAMLVYEKVYKPEARRKVHQIIQESLDYPKTTDNTNYYRITQLITYSNERDVVPFQESGVLDELYGMPRPKNYGLFYMLEAWQNIHIAY